MKSFAAICMLLLPVNVQMGCSRESLRGDLGEPASRAEIYDFAKKNFGVRVREFLEFTLKKKAIEREKLEALMQVKMSAHPLWKGQIYFSGLTSNGFKYAVVYGPIQGVETAQIIFPLELSNSSVGRCELLFQETHKMLKKLGFEGRRKGGQHANAPRNIWSYLKDSVRVELHYDSSARLNYGQDVAAPNLCVESIEINVKE